MRKKASNVSQPADDKDSRFILSRGVGGVYTITHFYVDDIPAKLGCSSGKEYFRKCLTVETDW